MEHEIEDRDIKYKNDKKRELSFNNKFNKKITNLQPNLKILELGSNFKQELTNIPKTLKTIRVGKPLAYSWNNDPSIDSYFDKSLKNLPDDIENVYVETLASTNFIQNNIDIL
jgi:hypothetical protein